MGRVVKGIEGARPLIVGYAVPAAAGRASKLLESAY